MLAQNRVIEDAKSRRPQSLTEVAVWGAALGQIDGFLRKFLDEFYSQSDQSARTKMLMAEPALSENIKSNAYLAAVAEYLSMQYQLTIPEWALRPVRFLTRPYFSAGLESLKATRLVESPTAFWRRMILVGVAPLYRPRKDKSNFG